MGMGQGSWQPQAGQDRVGDSWQHGTGPGGSRQDTSGAGDPAAARDPAACRQGATGAGKAGRAARGAMGHRCRQLPSLAAAKGGSGTRARCRGASRAWAGCCQPQQAACSLAQSGCRQGAGGPGQGAGATERVQAGCGQGAALPLKRGAMFQAAMPPCFMNCPRATSKKKMGMPPTKTMSR